IILIGMGIALLVNSIMPNLQPKIDAHKKHIESKFGTILYEYAAKLRDSTRTWDEKEMIEVEEVIEEAKSIAILDVENHLLRKKMRQFVTTAASSEAPIQQKEMIADYFNHLSENVDATDTTSESFDKLNNCMITLRNSKLPTTREEFEVRANLFYLIFEIENYLKVKRKLFTKWTKSN